MMKYGLAGALLLSTGLGAFAADLPQAPRAPVYVPPPPPLWVGPFVGIHAGGSWGDPGNNIGGKGLYCVGNSCNEKEYGGDFGFVTGGKSDNSGFGAGVQIGYNMQTSPDFLIGGVVDFTWLDRSSSRAAVGPTVPIAGGWVENTYYQDSFKHNWLATARVRAGFVMDNLLIYATGGLAMGGLESSSSSTTTWTPPGNATLVAGSGSGSSDSVAFGWTVGAGIEFRLSPNWSLYGEYLYYSLRDSYSVTFNTNPACCSGVAASQTYRVRADGDGHLVKVGLNYSFWSEPAYIAPVIARY
jgi:outer membrane immunogenic protein